MPDENAIQPVLLNNRKPEALKAEAEAIVNEFVGMANDVAEFPKNIEEARLKLSLRGLDAALACNTTLTTEQAAAAVILGGGSTFDMTAEALGVSKGQLIFWDRTIPEFRMEINYQRELNQVDAEGRLHQALNVMFARFDDLKPQDQIKLMALSQKIGEQPEIRRRWLAEYAIKKEDIELRKKQLEMMKGADHSQAPRVEEIVDKAGDDVYDIEDGDFEVETPEMDEL